MMVRVQKWGNSLRVRIPRSVARQVGITEGTELEVLSSGSGMVLRSPRVPSLKQLLAQMRPRNRPQLIEWDQEVGKKVW